MSSSTSALYIPVQSPVKDCDSRLPNHVTVLFPFLPVSQVSPDVLAKLSFLAQQVSASSVVFDRVFVFPSDHVVFLPKDNDFFLSLIASFADCFNVLPYGGLFAEVVPHMTVANVSQSSRKVSIVQRFVDLLPLSGVFSELVLCETSGKPYRTLHRFSFAQ